jgi:hypothetical protein
MTKEMMSGTAITSTARGTQSTPDFSAVGRAEAAVTSAPGSGSGAAAGAGATALGGSAVGPVSTPEPPGPPGGGGAPPDGSTEAAPAAAFAGWSSLEDFGAAAEGERFSTSSRACAFGEGAAALDPATGASAGAAGDVASWTDFSGRAGPAAAPPMCVSDTAASGASVEIASEDVEVGTGAGVEEDCVSDTPAVGRTGAGAMETPPPAAGVGSAGAGVAEGDGGAGLPVMIGSCAQQNVATARAVMVMGNR